MTTLARAAPPPLSPTAVARYRVSSARLVRASTAPRPRARARATDDDDADVDGGAQPSTSTSSASEFEPRVDVRATVVGAVIFAAFAVVNRRIAGAVERRKAREALEKELQRVKVERLSGDASVDDEEDLRRAYDEALIEEVRAREVFGGLFRVRMPQPLGKALSEVEKENRLVDETSAKLKGRRSSDVADTDDRDQGEAQTMPPWWMTSVSTVVVILLTWSAIGLGSVDPVTTAPPLDDSTLEAFRRGRL